MTSWRALFARSFASRALLAAANEGLKAAWMLALTIWMARNVPVEEFAGYTISATIYLIAAGINQGATVMTHMVVTGRGAQERMGHALGASLVMSAVPMLIFSLLAISALRGPVATTGAAFVAVTPALMLQHSAVGLLYSARAIRAALSCNLVWVTAGALLLLVVPPWLDEEAAWTYVIAWGAAAAVSAAFGFYLLGERPILVGVGSWFARHRGVILDLTGTDGLARISGQSSTWVLALVGGLPITAGLRASQIPLGIPRILLTGLSPMMLSEGTRVAQSGVEALRRLVRLWTLAVSAVVAVVGGVAYFMPEDWGRAIAGESWEYAVPIIPFAVLIALANTVIVPALTGFNSMGATRDALKVRMWTAALPALGTLMGGLSHGPIGAVQGAAAGMGITAVVTLYCFERAARKWNDLS